MKVEERDEGYEGDEKGETAMTGMKDTMLICVGAGYIKHLGIYWNDGEVDLRGRRDAITGTRACNENSFPQFFPLLYKKQIGLSA